VSAGALAVLGASSVVRAPRGASPSARDRLTASGVALPASYLQLLEAADGVSAYGGYFRVFGVDEVAITSLLTWNADSTWKFAWPAHAREYLCFGETAFGDQYAFRYDELRRSSPRVYLLEALGLEPEALAADFDGFLVDEFLPNARRPDDKLVVAARKRIGDLALDDHVTFSPSPLLTGEESVEHIVKMPAAIAMIFNGDLATQLTGHGEGRAVERIDVVDDDHGRPRLQVVWASA
jgi:hypothetical protein